MKARELIAALESTLEASSQLHLAMMLGITANTLINWKNQSSDLTPRQVAHALRKAREAAISNAQHNTVKPIVEHFKLQCCKSKRGGKYELFPTTDSVYRNGLRDELDANHGIYMFYDSGGRALYVGKARRQTLWKEMNNAFNRDRERQKLFRIEHPSRNQPFHPQYKKGRQPYQQYMLLHELAAYFSAYAVDDGMIDDLEALIVRSFANDLLNGRMEKFAHARP